MDNRSLLNIDFRTWFFVFIIPKLVYDDIISNLVSGLRGNKLDMRSVYNLLNILEQSEHFPTLVWVDFRNNKGINTIPGELVQRFTKRRTRQQGSNEDAIGKTVFSVQDAINGRVV